MFEYASVPTYKWKSIWNNFISIGVSSLKIKTSTLNSSRSRSERASWRGSTLLEWRHRYSNLPYFLFQRPNRKSKSQYSKSVFQVHSPDILKSWPLPRAQTNPKLDQKFGNKPKTRPTKAGLTQTWINPKRDLPKTGPIKNWINQKPQILPTPNSTNPKRTFTFLDFLLAQNYLSDYLNDLIFKFNNRIRTGLNGQIFM